MAIISIASDSNIIDAMALVAIAARIVAMQLFSAAAPNRKRRRRGSRGGYRRGGYRDGRGGYRRSRFDRRVGAT